MNAQTAPEALPTWRIRRALRASTLPSDSRHIMHVLADIADNLTSELPPRRTPSTRQLAVETGLSESTVIRRRTELEAGGWLILTRPTPEQSARHDRIRYRLAIPPEGAHRDHERAAHQLGRMLAGEEPGVQLDTPRFPAVSQTPAGVSESQPGGSQADTPPEPDCQPDTPGVSHSHPGGVSVTPLYKDDHLDHQDHQKPPAAAGDRAQRLQTAEELTDAFWRVHGPGSAQRRQAVRAVVITAVADNGVPRDVAAHALNALAVAGQQITPDSLTKALARMRQTDPETAPAPSIPKPPRRLCQVHPMVELTESGLCHSCAGDARAAPDDDLDPPAPDDAYGRRIPPPRPHDALREHA